VEVNYPYLKDIICLFRLILVIRSCQGKGEENFLRQAGKWVSGREVKNSVGGGM
jgi:hypothetical protein